MSNNSNTINSKDNFTTSLNLRSIAFEDGGIIPDKYTCREESFIPPLLISGVQAEAKSLVLILHDSDSPKGDFTHWLVWNIPPETKEINIGTDLILFRQGLNDFGKIGYGAPCPNLETHHYIFELFSLNAVLNLEKGASRKALEEIMRPHILDTTTLVGLVKASENV